MTATSTTFAGFATGAVLLGLGTAMVYPTLLAAIGDVAHPTWRASSVGIYRLWRDLGYAVGALLAGVVADAFGLSAATLTIAALTFGSGLVAAVRMRETLVRYGSRSHRASARAGARCVRSPSPRATSCAGSPEARARSTQWSAASSSPARTARSTSPA